MADCFSQRSRSINTSSKRKRVNHHAGIFTRLRFLMLRKYQPDAQAREYFREFPDPSLARRACIATLRIFQFPRVLSCKTRNPNLNAQHQNLRFGLALALCLLTLPSSAVADEPDPQILAHYMPWYEAAPETKKWGWHWTMNHFDPDKVGANGRREIAGFHYPSIGPYDSGDPHVLEYHVLLMKLSGIDGVIIDWYGSRDFRDYPMIDRNTRALIPWLKKAGLSFTFCYEDQTIKHMVADKVIAASDDVAEFVGELNKLADEFFSDESWIKSGDKPVLLTFGPQHFRADAWKQALKQCKLAPKVFGMPHADKHFELEGSFAWPPVHDRGIVAPETWRSFLTRIYKDSKKEMIPVVFPGFRDIYSDAKVQKSHGVIDERDGLTFAESLKLARETKANLIQIATWNDFGEGTIIEPTRECGLRYLEHLIETDNNAQFQKADLILPLQLYRLRKSNAELADEVAKAMFDGDCKLARKLLAQPR